MTSTSPSRPTAPEDVPTRTLADGLVLPAIGFGTYPLKGFAGRDAVADAIGAGYRLIDTAYNYENEGAVGAGVRQSGVPRDELVLQTKLPGRYHRHDDAVTAVQESLLRAGLDHWDLVLIHWPNPGRGLYAEAFAALLSLRDAGLVRSVGVSNFLPEHLDSLKRLTGELPTVNQVELHPHFAQPEQRGADEARGVLTQSWSPLARGPLLEEPVIQEVARAHGRTPGQVVLRWHVELGAVPLPKSGSAERRRENLAVFDFTLSPDEVAAISGLSRPDGRTNDQDPAVYEEL
ncbi:aldo/keto reductase [Cellulomonas sp. PSBB021]|uniref:aldo/keto reductase n=1 Tax=Cellulomonas sp. PSBB021 TaxID=2003551 RepID=UPI000B8D9FE1|nr:aldo/keto reductase [Cellulomonas sp. PSBB021]ASR56642.1 2,5-diketo-D-gluconic acid reductase [Cellulomonas sp. PSBB021]